jgi:hypothetical protein
MAKAGKVPIYFSLTRLKKAQLTKLAKARGISVSEMVEEMWDHYVKKE